MFFVPILAYLLVVQSVLLPVARAQAIELAGQDAALSIICSTTLPVSGEDGSDPGKKHVHDLGCCTLCARAALDVPAVVPVAVDFPREPARIGQTLAFVPCQSRAPPAITATPTQSRAPPAAA